MIDRRTSISMYILCLISFSVDTNYASRLPPYRREKVQLRTHVWFMLSFYIFPHNMFSCAYVDVSVVDFLIPTLFLYIFSTDRHQTRYCWIKIHTRIMLITNAIHMLSFSGTLINILFDVKKNRFIWNMHKEQNINFYLWKHQ
jgi:hypothetical protein